MYVSLCESAYSSFVFYAARWTAPYGAPMPSHRAHRATARAALCTAIMVAVVSPSAFLPGFTPRGTSDPWPHTGIVDDNLVQNGFSPRRTKAGSAKVDLTPASVPEMKQANCDEQPPHPVPWRTLQSVFALVSIGIVIGIGGALLLPIAVQAMPSEILDASVNTNVILQTTLLSVTSSLDNFAVGMSLGIVQQPLTVRLNGIVAVCNACGALVSAGAGATLGSLFPSAAGAFAASIFGYLAFCEVRALATDDDSELSKLAGQGLALQLAIPMTLNNLAGGVAGGLSGAGPLEMGFGALCASYGLMALGHRVGGALNGVFDSRVVAACVFFYLAANQLRDVITGT